MLKGRKDLLLKRIEHIKFDYLGKPIKPAEMDRFLDQRKQPIKAVIKTSLKKPFSTLKVTFTGPENSKEISSESTSLSEVKERAVPSESPSKEF